MDFLISIYYFIYYHSCGERERESTVHTERDLMLTFSNLQVPFPMGVNVRTRPGKARTNTHEDSHQGSPPKSGNGEDYTGDASSGSSKELD